MGLLINFDERKLMDGVKRLILWRASWREGRTESFTGFTGFTGFEKSDGDNPKPFSGKRRALSGKGAQVCNPVNPVNPVKTLVSVLPVHAHHQKCPDFFSHPAAGSAQNNIPDRVSTSPILIAMVSPLAFKTGRVTR